MTIVAKTSLILLFIWRETTALWKLFLLCTVEVYFTYTLQVKYIPDSMGETVDIGALLFGGYARFIPLDIIVLYG